MLFSVDMIQTTEIFPVTEEKYDVKLYVAGNFGKLEVWLVVLKKLKDFFIG